MKLALISCLSLFPVITARLVKLDDSNFDEMTKDKVVFVKFFAPWCGHCKSMAADWEKLAGEITDPNVLIAEVDCTDEGSEEICEDNDVDGYPSLKYGDGSPLKDYDDGLDYEEMLKFANENLHPNCSPKNIDICDAEQKEVIEKHLPMSLKDLETIIEGIDDMLDELDTSFEDSTDMLEEEYEKMHNVRESKQKRAKEDSNYSNLKAVLEKKMSMVGSNSEL